MNMEVRKMLAFLPLLLGIYLFTSCDDEKKIEFKSLPNAAQNFMETYFSDVEIASIIREKDDGTNEYQVKLSDGTELEFDQKGEWINIECFFSSLPEGILPDSVPEKVEELHPGGYINGVDKELGGYVVEITAADGIDWEMRFNSQFKYLSQSQERND